jgi:lipoprotein NlpI
VLWLYFARARAGADAAGELAASAPELAAGWPQPVILFLSGKLTTQALMAAALHPDAKKQAEQQCEARFYAGQWHLIRGEKTRAAELLGAARASCPKTFTEYAGAVAELKRLGF